VVQVAEEVSRRSPDFLLVLSKELEEELSFLFLLAPIMMLGIKY
jgi:hypothetical protein